MTITDWGATPSEWDHLYRLVGEDIRPSVTAPVEIDGELKFTYSKNPSIYFSDGQVGRYKGWVTRQTTLRQFEEWRNTHNLGAGIACRTIRCIDIDIDDEEKSDEVYEWLCDYFEADLFYRGREGSGRKMVLYRIDDAEETLRKKRVLKTPYGSVEFLFERQFALLAGRHYSGARMMWPLGFPADLEAVASIPGDEADQLARNLANWFGVAAPASFERDSVEEIERQIEQIALDDPEYQYVINHECYREHLPDGKVAVWCPRGDLHSHKELDVEDPSKTVYIPAGVGGVSESRFVCMHTSHGSISTSEFLRDIGFMESEFPIESCVEGGATKVSEAVFSLDEIGFAGVTKSGIIPSNPMNVALALEHPWFGGVEVFAEEFVGDTFYKIDNGKWHHLDDEGFSRILLKLSQAGILSINERHLQRAITVVASQNKRDFGIERVRELKWDGKDRYLMMAKDILKVDPYDLEYAQGVVRYLMTALVGRILQPGIKVDMVPVLISDQGCRKSTFVNRLSLSPDWAGTIRLTDSDDDNARKMRGKSVLEVAELRGLKSRSAESIKDWITKTTDEWVPKYREHSTSYHRRSVLIGTTNNRRFLHDPTGNRRWLPLEVGLTGPYIDTDLLSEHRDQIWAQAAVDFEAGGIYWEVPEKAAAERAHRYVEKPPMVHLVSELLQVRQLSEGIDATMVAQSLYGRQTNHFRVLDIERCLVFLGYTFDRRTETWNLDFL